VSRSRRATVPDLASARRLGRFPGKIRNQSSFPDEGNAELGKFHDRVLANFDLTLNIFMTPDRLLARKLLREKSDMQDLERLLMENHFAWVSEGRAVPIESSSLHLDILCDLKRIDSHLTSVAYPILERLGELRKVGWLAPMRSPIGLKKIPAWP
jgi:phosphate:Na+ symporter